MISDLLLLEFDEEAKKTRAMLERVPINPDFKPHPKSMPLRQACPSRRGARRLWSHNSDHTRVGFR